MYINRKVNEIVNEEGPCIIVLKGIDRPELDKDNKYFSFSIDYYDTVDLQAIKKEIRKDVLQKVENDEDYFWMTIEEYQLFKDFEIINDKPIVVLENNLFDKQYPYQGTLRDIDNIYNAIYYQEDKSLDSDEIEVFENVSTFYGQIDFSKHSNRYYVTYPEFEGDLKTYKLYEETLVDEEIDDNHPTKDVIQIELSDNEIPFLDLTMNIIEEREERDIILIFSQALEELPNNYLNRIGILKNITDKKLYFSTISMKRKLIERENNYLKILNDVFGYDAFKEISFYKNIENRSKETIEISQAQIIDDIVTQSEKAILEEDFRDIYITASTGAGKSLMFQIPALFLADKFRDNKPLTLVISPLIGLMNDQVEGMKRKGITNSATIHGNTPPYEREQILEGIQKQKIDILYLSPETLQARSDIKMLIGERIIGSVIIDEAHIVTTWGKSFRSDYWYLGIYLAKLRKQYKFPIVTFTATSIYGGREDMYVDTRNSLNMISPISYFGVVRRNDIIMKVRHGKKAFENAGRDYRKTKFFLTLRHLERSYERKQKSLVYFPTVRLLQEFYGYLNQNTPIIKDITGRYHGQLNKEEREEVQFQFKNGDLQFVLATKAFGMGIDIPDITNVYHYAPTGNVVDYIQEIGRAARDNDKVPYGFGNVDFLLRDMNEVKRLYGMSAIRKDQILEVMNKILSVYREKNNNRNLIISPEDFKYIFSDRPLDEDSLDNRVKTVLLMIEKDFESPNKLGYSPFVARPRSLYGNDLIFVTSELERQFTQSKLSPYFSKAYDINSENYSAVYTVNLSGIWEKYYRNMSFPSFKYCLFNRDELKKLKHHHLFGKFIFASGVEVILNNKESARSIISYYNRLLENLMVFFNQYRMTEKFFRVQDLGKHLMRNLKISDRFQAMAFAQNIINAAFEFSKIKGVNYIFERLTQDNINVKYKINMDGDLFSTFIQESIKYVLNPKNNYSIKDNRIISFHIRGNDRSNNRELDSQIAALGIGENQQKLTYAILGGNNPQIYLRMNSVYPLEKAIKDGNFYKNNILSDVQMKHYTSVEMLQYLFTKEVEGETTKEKVMNYTKWFWDQIENYFMGIIPDEVKANLSKPRK